MNPFMDLNLNAVDVSTERKVYHNGACWMLGAYVKEPYASRYSADMDERAFAPIDQTQTLAHRGEQPIGSSPNNPFTSFQQLLGDDVYNLEEQFHDFILNQLAQFGHLTGAQIRTMVQESNVAKAFIARWGNGDIVTFYLSRAVSQAWHDLAKTHAV